MKKLHIRAAALLLALLLTLSLAPGALAADVSAAAEADKTILTVSKEEQTVMVTITFSEPVVAIAYSAHLLIPKGWSTAAADVKLNIENMAGTGEPGQVAGGYSAVNDKMAKVLLYSFGKEEDELARITGFTIRYTVSGEAETGEETLGLEQLTVTGQTGSTVLDLVTAAVTVTVNAPPPPYELGRLSVYSEDGEELDALPAAPCLVTVPVTKNEAAGDCLVLLAAYDADGRLCSRLLYVSLENAAPGVGVKLTLPLDNSAGGIARLKAFCVASFASPAPLGSASAFPAEA